MSWSIDGVVWEYPCTIERTSEIEASDVSGMMLDKTYFNDVIGTFLKYKVAIAIPKGDEDNYTTIYEVLTDPVGWHRFTLPYNQGMIEVIGRVSVVSDVWVRLPHGKQTWRKTTFEVIGSAPTKVKSLDEILSYGMTPYPDVASVEVGDIYEYTESGWVLTDYGDGDNTYY